MVGDLRRALTQRGAGLLGAASLGQGFRLAGSRVPKMNDPTCQRQVGSPWEGDFGLFYQGSTERGP